MLDTIIFSGNFLTSWTRLDYLTGKLPAGMAPSFLATPSIAVAQTRAVGLAAVLIDVTFEYPEVAVLGMVGPMVAELLAPAMDQCIRRPTAAVWRHRSGGK